MASPNSSEDCCGDDRDVAWISQIVGRLYEGVSQEKVNGLLDHALELWSSDERDARLSAVAQSFDIGYNSVKKKIAIWLCNKGGPRIAKLVEDRNLRFRDPAAEAPQVDLEAQSKATLLRIWKHSDFGVPPHRTIIGPSLWSTYRTLSIRAELLDLLPVLWERYIQGTSEQVYTSDLKKPLAQLNEMLQTEIAEQESRESSFQSQSPRSSSMRKRRQPLREIPAFNVTHRKKRVRSQAVTPKREQGGRGQDPEIENLSDGLIFEEYEDFDESEGYIETGNDDSEPSSNVTHQWNRAENQVITPEREQGRRGLEPELEDLPDNLVDDAHENFSENVGMLETENNDLGRKSSIVFHRDDDHPPAESGLSDPLPTFQRTASSLELSIGQANHSMTKPGAIHEDNAADTDTMGLSTCETDPSGVLIHKLGRNSAETSQKMSIGSLLKPNTFGQTNGKTATDPIEIKDGDAGSASSPANSGPLLLAIDTLEEGKWLNSTAIEYSLAAFKREHDRFVDPCMLKPNEQPNAIKPLLADPEQHMMILPVHHRSHWSLALFDLKKNEINYYDSLISQDEIHAVGVYALLTQFAHQRLPRGELAWKFVFQDSPRQTNSDDCGVYVVLNYCFFINNRALPGRIDASFWRRYLKYVLSSQLPDSLKPRLEMPSLSVYKTPLQTGSGNRLMLLKLEARQDVGIQTALDAYELFEWTLEQIDRLQRDRDTCDESLREINEVRAATQKNSKALIGEFHEHLARQEVKNTKGSKMYTAAFNSRQKYLDGLRDALAAADRMKCTIKQQQLLCVARSNTLGSQKALELQEEANRQS